MNYPKRLIEVDLPIKKISEYARREKSVSTISSLHLWWARRPLAACRAVICAAIWPDPADPFCPDKFRNEAARLMMKLRNKRGGTPRNWNDGIQLRQALLDFIAEFANWDNSFNKDYIETSKMLTQVAHESLSDTKDSKPMLIDPFAGGGAIPLEALRIGADTFASDLNPVAVLLNKVVIEYIPQFGQRLADAVRQWGGWVKNETENELAEFYPKDPDGSVPIAYLWARTVVCEGPNCGANIPLLSSYWVANHDRESIALQPVIQKNNKDIKFRLYSPSKPTEVPKGTVQRGAGTCLICGYTVSRDRVQEQMLSTNGGTSSSRLMCIVLKKEGKSGRIYRLPNQHDLEIISITQSKLHQIINESKSEISPIPTEELPYLRSIFNVYVYGMNQWHHLYNSRQLLTMITFVKKIRHLYSELKLKNEDHNFVKAVITILALGVSRTADHLNSGCTWNPKGPKLQHLFTRQAIGMIWDFAEANPFAGSVGDWTAWLSGLDITFKCVPFSASLGQSVQASAADYPLPDDSCDIIVTDPPYYDAVPYANLSDFFYVWLKRILFDVYPDLFKEVLTPKEGEIVQLAERNQIYSYKTKDYFEKLMTNSLAEARRVLKPKGIGVVFFAHKGTSAWEAQLQAILDAGWVIVASWPIDTEMKTRLRAMNSAVLASSVELVCRPRENPDGSLRTDEIGDWRDVLAELPKRIHEWMPRLAEEGVVGADSIFACLGPALEIFSRYSRVEKASGEVVTLKEYLEHVWAAVAKEALNMIFEGAETTGFEEDARLTAMWLWTLSTGAANGNENPPSSPFSKGGESEDEEDEGEEEKPSSKAKLSGYTLEYDAARKIAQGLGAHLERLQSLVELKGDKARLLPVAERTKALFGKSEADAPRGRKKKKEQLSMFAEIEEAEEAGSWGEKNIPQLGNTTLDRLHQAMILFAAGRGEALKRFLIEEGVGRDERFWRLAQALSALYPKSSDEKRWVDGVLARKKGLGF